MRNLLFILLMLSQFVISQNVIKEGYWTAVQGDSVGKNRSEMHKAQADGKRMWQSNQNETIYLYPPERFRLEFTKEDQIIVEQFRIDTITKEEKETSVIIYIEFNRDNLKHVYVKYREFGGEWQETTRGISNIHSPGLLKQQTEYEYMVFAVDLNGNEINSDLLIFKTL